MATTTIANLPALAVMTDSSAIPVDTGTDTFKMSGANLKNYFGSASLISNGTSYANIASTDGNVVISADGSEWTFGTDGNLTFPTGNLVITPDDPAGNIASIVSTDHQLAILSTGANGAVATVWVEDYANVGTSNIAAVYANPTPESKIVRIAVGQNGSPGPNLWDFGTDGSLTFPTANIDLHNGGVQSGEVLQFGNPNLQSIITGPTPAENVSAQRLIIQGQRGNGTGEGGDVYVWGGDADTNGGDIKIYAGDADNVSTGGGGYINLAGGDGFDNGGHINIDGGQGETDGGAVNIQGGYGTTGQGGTVQITGGAAPLQGSYGNVEIGSGTYAWLFDNTGNLTLPANTFAVNYANGTPVSIGGGSGVSIVPNDVTYGTGSLYGNTNPGFTVVTGDDDDEAYSIPVDFPIEFLGNSYSDGNVFLVSNSYLTFGPTEYTDYDPVGPVVIPVPAIFVGTMDLSNQKYYYGYADGTDVFVIGYEGSIATSGQEDYPAIKWELQVSAATPDQIIIVVDGPAGNGGALNFPAGVWGISDGAEWIDQFQPLPWYSNNNDDTYNAITIAPVVPVAVSTIAFTGPGVTYSENGGTTFINIDPFDQAISVAYNQSGNGAIISAVYDELTLTTAGDGDDLNLIPLGDVNIVGGSKSDNQPGSGYQVKIYGGDAHDVPNSPGQNYNGGNILIEGGIAVNAGTPGRVNIISNGNTWTFAPTGGLTFPDSTVQSTAYPGGGYALPVCVINSSTTGSGSGEVSVNFTVTNPSGVAITAIGIFLPSVNTSSAVQLAASAAAGTQSKTLTSLTGYTRYWAQVYAETDNGTAYSAPNYLSVTSICLLAGTMIALADGTYKTIEDITYTDRMLSWDFDLGCYAETKAVWIKQTETGSQYNLLTFSDGTTLRTFDQHRIFNKQAGSFTYPMTDATPIGTITVNEHGQEITLISKEIVVDTIEYYNVITDYHMNLFSDSILTSCRFNNIYPITDMKFVKDTRTLRTRDEFENIPDRFFYGLRLAEQTFDLAMIEWYVNRLLSVEQSVELVAV